MGKIEYVNYVVLGAGAVALPQLVGSKALEYIAKVPGIGNWLVTPLTHGITPAAVLLAGASILVIDHFIFNK